MKYLAFAFLLAAAAHAESPAPCTGFTWPMARELAMMDSAPGAAMPSGTKMQTWPEGAERLELTPGGEAAFLIPPGKAPKALTTSGFFSMPAPAAAGTYQISLSDGGWIDVIQDGRLVESGAHTSDHDCPAIRKSVRFDLAAAPVTLQISGSDATSIVITILPAAD